MGLSDLQTRLLRLGNLPAPHAAAFDDEVPSLRSLFVLAQAVEAGGRADATAEYVEALEQVGAMLITASRRAEGAIVLRSACDAASRCMGPEDVANDRIMRSLAAVYATLGFASYAAPLYELLLEQRERSLGPNHRQTRECLVFLATFHYGRGDYPRALPLYERLLGGRDGDGADGTAAFARRALEYGHVLTWAGKNDDGAAWYDRAAADLADGRGRRHDDMARGFYLLATNLLRAGRTPEGRQAARTGAQRLAAMAGDGASPVWQRWYLQLRGMADGDV